MNEFCIIFERKSSMRLDSKDRFKFFCQTNKIEVLEVKEWKNDTYAARVKSTLSNAMNVCLFLLGENIAVETI